MKIGYNPSSMEAYNAMLKTGRGMKITSARLSTGIKINSASQNAAGLAISNTIKTQAEGIEKASQNSSNAISLLQTAEAALNEMHAILQRMRELAVQANNDTNEVDDRANLQLEINQLIGELNSMSDRCEFNQMKLLSGGEADPNAIGGRQNIHFVFHTGANKNYNMKIQIPQITSLTLGFYDAKPPDNAFDPTALNRQFTDPADPNFWSVSNINIVGEAPPPVGLGLSSEDAREMRNLSLTIADAAVEELSRRRAELGAYINRLQHTVTYLDTSSTAARSSLSRIYDTDMAAEMSNYSRLQILTQAATSIMAQANQAPQNVLQLLR